MTLCLEVARRITLLMLEVAAAQGLSITPPSDAELVAMRDRQVARLERVDPGCKLTSSLPDAVLKGAIKRNLGAKDS